MILIEQMDKPYGKISIPCDEGLQMDSNVTRVHNTSAEEVMCYEKSLSILLRRNITDVMPHSIHNNNINNYSSSNSQYMRTNNNNNYNNTIINNGQQYQGQCLNKNSVYIPNIPCPKSYNPTMQQNALDQSLETHCPLITASLYNSDSELKHNILTAYDNKHKFSATRDLQERFGARKLLNERRKKRMKKIIYKREFMKLKNVIPSLATKSANRIDELTILNEAIRHIAELESLIMQKYEGQSANSNFNSQGGSSITSFPSHILQEVMLKLANSRL